MKKIRKFNEQKEQEHWIVYTSEGTRIITNSEESAENHIINLVYDLMTDKSGPYYEKFKDEDIITDVNEAIDWYDWNFQDDELNYTTERYEENIKMSKEIKLKKEQRKFNL